MKTSGSTESTIRLEKGGVRVGGDGGETLTSRLRMSLLTNSSTSAAQIMVEFDEGKSGAIGKSVKKSSKKSKKHQRSEKLAKAIGSEECLPRHQFSVN